MSVTLSLCLVLGFFSVLLFVYLSWLFSYEESSMVNEASNKFTWMIKDFSSLGSEIMYSDEFQIGGCKWRLMAYPMGDKKWNKKYMSLYLDVADSKYLPSGWTRHARFYLTVVNQLSEILSQEKVKFKWFDEKTPASGFVTMIPHSMLRDKNGGFIVNGEVKIVVKINVFKVIGKEVDDVSVESEEESENESEKEPQEKSDEESNEESEEESEKEPQETSNGESNEESEEESEKEPEKESRPRKKIKRNDDGNFHKETMDVNGFEVLPSQVNFVSRIFNKYPDIALEFRSKNKHLKTACMNVILSLIATLCQSPQKLSNEDMVEADNALAYAKEVGFKVDWLEKKLEEVKKKKEEAQTSETWIQVLEEELEDFKHKCVDTEALLEKAKVKVLAAKLL